MAIELTKTEREIVILKVIWEMVDEMVNYGMFERFTKETDVNLAFKSPTHQRMFNVLLGDFLSRPGKTPFGLDIPPQNATPAEQSVLFHLKRVCDDPQFNDNAKVLSDPLDALINWLEGECRIEKVWFPSIGLETSINVKRIVFIKICGNIAKHAFIRLDADTRGICQILESNGAKIEPEQALLVIPEFYDWFHRDVFNYHSSTIAEFLNNLRLGIYDYLQTEFRRSFKKNDPSAVAYCFAFPADCRREVVRAMYVDLMNAVRRAPFMPRFEITPYLKMRY